jgi:hypothetical protein
LSSRYFGIVVWTVDDRELVRVESLAASSPWEARP